mgnify:FL=1
MPADYDANPEVLPPATPTFTVPKVKVDLNSTLQSPFFWLLIGIGVGCYLWHRKNKKGWV